MRVLAIRSSLVAAVLLMAAGAAGAATIEVKVPFSFSVHGETMPAGKYVVRTVDMGSNAVEIQGAHATKDEAFIMTKPSASQDPAAEMPALTFTRHETTYALTGISWGQGQAVSTY